jgi:hypothetical protein
MSAVSYTSVVRYVGLPSIQWVSASSAIKSTSLGCSDSEGSRAGMMASVSVTNLAEAF